MCQLVLCRLTSHQQVFFLNFQVFISNCHFINFFMLQEIEYQDFLKIFKFFFKTIFELFFFFFPISRLILRINIVFTVKMAK